MKPNLLLTLLIAGLITNTVPRAVAQEAPPPPAANEDPNAPAPPPEDGTPQPPEDNAPAVDASTNTTSTTTDTTTVAVTNVTTTVSTPVENTAAIPMKAETPSVVIVQKPVAKSVVVSNPISKTANGAKGLRMNFRGVPLETVLNYMSDAAGYIIHPKVDVKGKIDVWSAQPLSKEEAVKLLKQMLAENGYTAIEEGRTLTILRTEDARKDSIPVITGNNFTNMPKTMDIVTQIIPVHTLNAIQLLKNLDSLKPSSATIIADESANSLVMTDTQSNIRHMTEIISALDSVSSSSTSIKVFTLKYADSKSLASLVKDLFPNADSKNNAGGGGFGGRFRGFGGGGFNPFGGGGGGGNTDNADNGHTPQLKVNAVSDDHSNSLIVTAPDELMPTLTELVTSVDKPVEDETEVRVFHLKNADASEMADLLTSLFPDESSSSSDATRSPFRFGPFGGGFGGQQNNSSASASERTKKMSKVTAVADRRTSSVVVTSGKDMMPQIVAMVDELDQSRARKQTPHVIPLANADPIDVQNILQELFPSSSSSGSRSGNNSSSSSQNNYLQNRATTQLQQQNSSTTSSFGSGTSSGGSGRGL